METVSFGIFGLIIGSFINVLIVRWGSRSISGRSECPACGTQIKWYDLVPILSWLLLLGRCRACGARISIRYVLVEASTAAIFCIIALAPLPIETRLFALPITAVLMAIAWYDLRTTYIPDPWVYAFIALAFFSQFVGVPMSALDPLALLLSGPAAAALLFAMWLVSRGRWMGFGDVKLALGIGYLLGAWSGFLAVMLAFMLGAVVSLAILMPLPAFMRVLTRWGIARSTRVQSYTMKSEVPFGPFLIAATYIIWISNMYGLQLDLALFGGLP